MPNVVDEESGGEGPPPFPGCPLAIGPAVVSDTLLVVPCPSPPPLSELGVGVPPALDWGTSTTLVTAGDPLSSPSDGDVVLLLLLFLLFLCTVPPTAPPTTAAMTTTAPMMKIAIHFFVLHHGTSLRGYGSSTSFDVNAASAWGASAGWKGCCGGVCPSSEPFASRSGLYPP